MRATIKGNKRHLKPIIKLNPKTMSQIKSFKKEPVKKAAAKKAGPKTFRPTKEETAASAKRLVKESTKKEQDLATPVIKLKLPYNDELLIFENITDFANPDLTDLVALKATEAGLQKIVAAEEVFKPVTSRNTVADYQKRAEENTQGYTIINTKLFLNLFFYPYQTEFKELYSKIDPDDLEQLAETAKKMEDMLESYLDRNILVHYIY